MHLYKCQKPICMYIERREKRKMKEKEKENEEEEERKQIHSMKPTKKSGKYQETIKSKQM